ncbi:MAG: hypothetical protein ACJ0BW_02935 [Pontiellaceae bacterium]
MPNKRFFTKHAKSSAALISIFLHLIIVIVALSYVAVSIIQKDDKTFEAKPIKRPVKKLKKLQVPVKEKKSRPKPKLRKQIVVKNLNRNTPDFKMPEISGIRGGLGSSGDGGSSVEAIGFTMPEMNFLGAKGKGEKVCFLVHFGQSTMQHALDMNGNPVYTPYSRMTSLVIRNRLSELISNLPAYTLFNVAGFQMSSLWAMSGEMLSASNVNKQYLFEWMESVNPIDPKVSSKYGTCFDIKDTEVRRSINNAAINWPTRVDEGLPFFTPKWIYPYEVSEDIRKKYVPDAVEFELKREDYPSSYFWGSGLSHWSRGVAWAVFEQKPDTIFILTTNYYDGWAITDKKTMSSGQKVREFDHKKMTRALSNMIRDNYGPDKKVWPKINIIVLAPAGSGDGAAQEILTRDFADVLRTFRGSGVVIDDIKDFMNDDELVLYNKFRNL